MCQRRGSVIMIVLWVVAILAIFAVSLGHRASINLQLVRYQRDALKAVYLARAGLNKSILILQEDAVDPASRDYDTQEACGVNLKSRNIQDLFSETWVDGGGSFKIGQYTSIADFRYGLSDEEGRININGATNFDNKTLLDELFKLRDITDSAKLAETVVNWIDADQEGPDAFKNQKLTAKEELSAALEYFYSQNGLDKQEAQNKAQEAYNRLRDYITVDSNNKININTASEEVLKAISRAIAKANARPETLADGLASRLIGLRSANPFMNKTAIDSLQLSDLQEQGLFDLLKPYLAPKSDSFRITVTGNSGKISKNIEAVYNRSSKKIVYWRQN